VTATVVAFAWWFGERAWWAWVDDQPLSEQEQAEIAACGDIGWSTGLKLLEQGLEDTCPISWFAEAMAPHVRVVGGPRSLWLEAKLQAPYGASTRWRAGSTLLVAGAQPAPELAVWSRLVGGDRHVLAERMREGRWPRGWEDPDLADQVDLIDEGGPVVGPELAAYLQRLSVLATDVEVEAWNQTVATALGVQAGLRDARVLPPELRDEVESLPGGCTGRPCLRLLARWARRDGSPDLDGEPPEQGEADGAGPPVTSLDLVLAGGDAELAAARSAVQESWVAWILAAEPPSRPRRWAAVVGSELRGVAGRKDAPGRLDLALDRHGGPPFVSAFAGYRLAEQAGLAPVIRSASLGLSVEVGSVAVRVDRCGAWVAPPPSEGPQETLGEPWPSLALEALVAVEAAASAGPEKGAALLRWAQAVDPEAAVPGPASSTIPGALFSALSRPLGDVAVAERRRGWSMAMEGCP
jgi:hypothetical protein